MSAFLGNIDDQDYLVPIVEYEVDVDHLLWLADSIPDLYYLHFFLFLAKFCHLKYFLEYYPVMLMILHTTWKIPKKVRFAPFPKLKIFQKDEDEEDCQPITKYEVHQKNEPTALENVAYNKSEKSEPDYENLHGTPLVNGNLYGVSQKHDHSVNNETSIYSVHKHSDHSASNGSEYVVHQKKDISNYDDNSYNTHQKNESSDSRGTSYSSYQKNESSDSSGTSYSPYQQNDISNYDDNLYNLYPKNGLTLDSGTFHMEQSKSGLIDAESSVSNGRLYSAYPKNESSDSNGTAYSPYRQNESSKTSGTSYSSYQKYESSDSNGTAYSPYQQNESSKTSGTSYSPYKKNESSDSNGSSYSPYKKNDPIVDNGSVYKMQHKSEPITYDKLSTHNKVSPRSSRKVHVKKEPKLSHGPRNWLRIVQKSTESDYKPITEHQNSEKNIKKYQAPRKNCDSDEGLLHWLFVSRKHEGKSRKKWNDNYRYNKVDEEERSPFHKFIGLSKVDVDKNTGVKQQCGYNEVGEIRD